MDSQLIRQRRHQGTKPFVFRLSDDTRVTVVHPDFMSMPPGAGLIIMYGKSGQETRINPLHVVAIEEAPSRKLKTNGKRRR